MKTREAIRNLLHQREIHRGEIYVVGRTASLLVVLTDPILVITEAAIAEAETAVAADPSATDVDMAGYLAGCSS